MTPTFRRTRNQSGVTLIELLIVLAIIAVAAALIAPSFTTPVRRPEPELAGFLKQMRAQALETGSQIAIHITEEGLQAGERGSREPVARFALPVGQSLALTWPSDRQFLPEPRLTVFYPDGTAILTRLTVQQARTHSDQATPLYSLTIDPVHGDITHVYR